MQQLIAPLHIESLVYGGNGLGYHDGKVIFVPRTAPGDRVACRVTKSKKRFAEARLVEVLEPSEERCPPLCPVFGECGGCQWQHLPYAVQGAWKERIFADLLLRQTGVEKTRIRPLVMVPDPWHYRSRAQLKMVVQDRQLRMGFFRRGSHIVVAHQQCPILHPRLNVIADLFRDALNGYCHAHHMPQLDLGIDDAGNVRAVLHYLGSDSVAVADLLRPVAGAAEISLFLRLGDKGVFEQVCGDADLFIQVGEPPLSLAYGPGGFAQINLKQNRHLVATVVDTVRQIEARQVLDLYCGMGNLSLPVAKEVERVTGVEDYGPAIAKARFNAQRLGIENADFYHLAAEKAIGRLQQQSLWDLIILDPPRTGAFAVVKELMQKRPGHILYVSCEPPTLVRDLQVLSQAGYDLEWSQPFDFFPQTHHIESVTLLRRK